MDKETLDKINKFTRREFTGDELFTFSVILCDNDIDRDGERFSDEALEQLCKLFVGRTGIFDHEPSTGNQNARIYDTEIVEDGSRSTKQGSPYKYLKASAYMVRTDDNKNLIAEIDGGIKKEVSISCSAAGKKCSVCGCDRKNSRCAHVTGRRYGGKLCHTVLCDITDAYEWSFVAVPAQVNAGVTKKYSDDSTAKSADDSASVIEAESELRRDIRRLAFFSGGRAASAAAELAAKNLSVPELVKLKKSYERLAGRQGVEVQLAPESKDDSAAGFRV